MLYNFTTHNHPNRTMKIGILTFHSAPNYGAMLQCYALQEVLKTMGHDVEVIDYRLDYRLRPYRLPNAQRFNPLSILKRIALKILTFRDRKILNKKFESFLRTYLVLSDRVDRNFIPNGYDVYIMGSDQIWNPKITQGFDSVFFGCFWFPKEDKKYISYAASMERTELSEGEKEFCSKVLDNFNAISVREKVLADLLQPLTARKVEVVLDPTLLLDKQVWSKIARHPKIKKKYVLVYQVRNGVNTMQIAKKVAEQINAIVIQVTGSSPYHNRRKLQHESPTQFLGLIQHAACVVTTSFHGTAFSMIFNRPFYYVESADGHDSRAKSLLSGVGLEERIIQVNDSPIFNRTDYDMVNDKLTEWRIQSLKFLEQNIQ